MFHFPPIKESFYEIKTSKSCESVLSFNYGAANVIVKGWPPRIYIKGWEESFDHSQKLETYFVNSNSTGI